MGEGLPGNVVSIVQRMPCGGMCTGMIALDQPRLLYSVPAVAEAESEFTLLKQAWADDYYVQAPIMPSEQQSIRLESYKVGDTVLATNANGQLVAFALPSAIFSDACSSLTSISMSMME